MCYMLKGEKTIINGFSLSTASPFFSLLFAVFLLYISAIFLAILLIVFSIWI